MVSLVRFDSVKVSILAVFDISVVYSSVESSPTV